jgi:hypothetical protein
MSKQSTEPEGVFTTGTDWLVQLLCWSLLIGLVPVTVGLFVPAKCSIPGSVSGALADALPAVIALSITCYAWLRFRASRHAQWLAASVAFASFAAFACAHICLSLLDNHAPYIRLAADWCSALSRVTPGLMLLMAATTRKTFSSSWSFRGCSILFVLWATLTGLGIAGTVSLARYVTITMGSPDRSVIYLMQLGPYMMSALVCLLAIISYAKRTVVLHDRISKILCLWLLPTAMGCGVRAVSTPMTSAYWWQAHLLDLTAAAVAAIGLNIDSAISDAQSTERLESIQAMHDISWSLAAAANLSSMLSAFVRVLSNVAGSRMVALYLLDETGESLRLEAAHGDDEGFLRIGTPYSVTPAPRPGFHNGHTARALQSQTVQVVEDVYSDVEFTPWRMVAQNNGWVVSIPLLLHGHVSIGVLNLYIIEDKRVTSDKINLLETMAGLVTPAIENRKNFIDAAALQRATNDSAARAA